MSKASDLLDNCVLFIPDCYRAPWTKIGPGGVIEGMSQKQRDILKSLKSADLQNVRLDSLCTYQEPQGEGRWGTRVK